MIDTGRKDILAALILGGLAFALWIPRLQGPIDLRWDGGAYYTLGTALVEGKGYRLLNEPGEIQSTLHPPMIPLIVALHQIALGSSDMFVVGWRLRIFYLFLFVGYIVACYFLFRRFLPIGYSFPAAAATMFQLHTIFMSDLIFPETPYGLATVMFVLSDGEAGRRTAGYLRGALAVTAFALRTIGISLLAAWSIESLLRRRFGQAIRRAIVLIVPLFVWTGYIALIESGAEYRSPAYDYQRADYTYINVSYARNLQLRDPFRPELGYATLKDRLARFADNLMLMPVKAGEAVSTTAPVWDLLRMRLIDKTGLTIPGPLTVRMVLICFTLFAAAGIALQFARGQYIIPLYILLSVGAICLTPWPAQFNRYLSPLTPFLMLSLFIGMRALVERIGLLLPAGSRRFSMAPLFAVVILIAVSQAATVYLMFTKWHRPVSVVNNAGERVGYRLFFYYDSDRMTDAWLDRVRERATGSEVIASSNPQLVYLRTGLKSVLPPLEIDPLKSQKLLDSVPVGYLILEDGPFYSYVKRVVTDRPDDWRPVHSAGQSGVIDGRSPVTTGVFERVGQ